MAMRRRRSEEGACEGDEEDQETPIELARRTLLEAVPEVAEKLAAKAATGSVSHMKLLLQLLGLESGGLKARAKKVKDKTLEEILLEQWAKQT